MLGLTEHPARRWEPKRLRLRLLSIAGRLARTGRRTVLHLAAHAPWAPLLAERSPVCGHALRLPDTQPTCPDDTRHPARGTGAHPSDLGRTVIPTMQNHAAKTGRHRPRSQPDQRRKIRASTATAPM
jgi:Transposase DDE domain group 1